MLDQSSAGSAPAPTAPEFADLYCAWRRRVCAFFFRRGVRVQDIEDLVQATFTDAWRSWPTHRWANERQFAAWLFTIALHQLFNARRRARRDTVVVSLDVEVHQPADERAGASFVQALDRVLLAPGLALLPASEQRLLADAYGGDQDDRGLGHRLHLCPDTAKARRLRAVRHLAVALVRGEPPRHHRRWPRRPEGMSERERWRTAVSRQRPNLAVLA